MQTERTAMLALRLAAVGLTLAGNMAPGLAFAAGSGGYSRPSISRPSPAVRAPSATSFPRSSTSSTGGSGGYRRPAERAPSTLSRSTSAGDIAVSRQSAGRALDDLRERSRTLPPAWGERDRTPSVRRDPPRRDTSDDRDDGPSFSWPEPRRRDPEPNYGGGYRNDNYGGGYANDNYVPAPRRRAEPVRPRWAGDPGWTAPSWVDPYASAGQWNPVFLWYLLDTLSRPGHAEWFRQHSDDAGYREWRRRADAAAASNPDLKGKLSALDAELGAPLSGARNEAYLPPDVTDAQAKASTGGGFVGLLFGALLVLLLLAGLAGGIVWLLSRRSKRSSAMGSTGVTDVARAAEGVVRNKLGVPREETRKPFRVGQAVSLPQAAFVLADGAARVAQPKETDTSVTAVGRLDGVPLTRIYLGDDRFLQVHLSDAGDVDECRYFAAFDTVTPATADEWAFWIPAEGKGDDPAGEWMIGFPVFETQDGARWDRVWSPGEATVPPVEATEDMELPGGKVRTRHLSAMLFARATGAEAPAPDREYLLVVAWREGGDAGVTLYAGIDLPVAGLRLTN